MIDEQTIDALIEILTKRIEFANIYFLKQVGSSIKKFKQLKPSQAQKLIQILKYGGNYEQIIQQVAKYLDMNVKDVQKIFAQYAKQDQKFYEQFYKYRNIPFIEYENNVALKRQTESIARMVQKEMYDYTRKNVLGYTIRDLEGNLTFLGTRDVYNSLLDTAYLNVGQGKETFDDAVRHILRDIGKSGLKTIDYESGKRVRLDSAIKTHLKSRLRELHNENQKLFGEEFGADGIEITVHEYPAPDHAPVQGRQFSNEQFDKLQAGEDAVDNKGNTYNLDHDAKNGYRPISEMNCYHRVFSIILGVNKPLYNEKQLNRILTNNENGFEFEGKHYTMYQGTQLQSTLERKIREQKDIQILARETDDQQLINEAQNKITVLTNKYRDLHNISGLPTRNERSRVSGYHRVKAKQNTE